MTRPAIHISEMPWARMTALVSRSLSGAAELKSHCSRSSTSPGWSSEMTLNSGTNIWSNFGSG